MKDPTEILAVMHELGAALGSESSDPRVVAATLLDAAEMLSGETYDGPRLLALAGSMRAVCDAIEQIAAARFALPPIRGTD